MDTNLHDYLKPEIVAAALMIGVPGLIYVLVRVKRAFDRVERKGESYVKDFRPLRLGVLRMAKGRGKLTLRAVEVAGKSVADVRWVMLTRRG